MFCSLGFQLIMQGRKKTLKKRKKLPHIFLSIHECEFGHTHWKLNCDLNWTEISNLLNYNSKKFDTSYAFCEIKWTTHLP